MRRTMVAGFGIAAFFCAGLVQGQGPGAMPAAEVQVRATAFASDLPPDAPEWGISAPIAYVVPGWTFNNRGDAQHDVYLGYMYNSGVGSDGFTQTVHVPSGAVIEGLTLFYYDADASADVSFAFSVYRGTPSAGFVPENLLADASTGSTGYQGGYRPLSVPVTVRNVDPFSGEISMYYLLLAMAPSGTATDLRFGGAVVWYRLQISPVALLPTFSDVPTNYWAFRHIEVLAASGITTGCGGGNFCPENPVTRAEMAVFLAKALGLHWPDGTPQ